MANNIGRILLLMRDEGAISTIDIFDNLKIPQDESYIILKKLEQGTNPLIRKDVLNNKVNPKKPMNHLIDCFELTPEGFAYLDRLAMCKMQKEQLRFNKILALTSIVLAFTGFLTFMSSSFVSVFFDSKTNSISPLGLLVAILFMVILIFVIGKIVEELMRTGSR